MKNTIICNEDLYFEHKLWRSELKFWDLELSFFDKQLEPLTRSITDKDIAARVDHFQNQFNIHRAKLDEIRDGIEDHEFNLALHEKAKVNAIDRIRYKSHIDYRERMNRERELYQELKKEYYDFLVQVIALDFEI